MTQGEKGTPLADLKLMVAVPALYAKACPCWLMYMTAGLLEVQVPLSPLKSWFRIGRTTPSLHFACGVKITVCPSETRFCCVDGGTLLNSLTGIAFAR